VNEPLMDDGQTRSTANAVRRRDRLLALTQQEPERQFLQGRIRQLK
jgi:hypothetical protein